jgi:isopropylmalate/homocitrate/citramalate synthase
MSKINHNGIEIDTDKAKHMLERIIIQETNNEKTKERNDGEMSKIIKKIIEEEARCL